MDSDVVCDRRIVDGASDGEFCSEGCPRLITVVQAIQPKRPRSVFEVMCR